MRLDASRETGRLAATREGGAGRRAGVARPWRAASALAFGLLVAAACGSSSGPQPVESAAQLAAQINDAGFGCAEDDEMVVSDLTSVNNVPEGQLERVECSAQAPDGDPETTLYLGRFEDSDAVTGFVRSIGQDYEDSYQDCLTLISGPNWTVSSRYYGDTIVRPLGEALDAGSVQSFGDSCG